MLVAGGDKGKRYDDQLENHPQPTAGGLSGRPSGEDSSHELNRKQAAIAKFSGQDVDELEAMMARDTYMGVQEAIDFGLLDHAL